MAEHAADFIDHLSGLTHHMPREEQLERVAMTARWELGTIREAVEQAMLAARGEAAVRDDAAVSELILGELYATIEQFARSEPGEGLSPVVVEREIGTAAWSRRRPYTDRQRPAGPGPHLGHRHPRAQADDQQQPTRTVSSRRDPLELGALGTSAAGGRDPHRPTPRANAKRTDGATGGLQCLY